jgi:hypothetical protein
MIGNVGVALVVAVTLARGSQVIAVYRCHRNHAVFSFVDIFLRYTCSREFVVFLNAFPFQLAHWRPLVEYSAFRSDTFMEAFG